MRSPTAASEIADRSVAVQTKLRRLRAVLERRGFDSALLSARRNFAWLTDGGDSHVVQASDDGAATIVVTADEAFVLTTVIEERRLRDEELAGAGLDVRAVPWDRHLEPSAGVTGRIARDADLESELRRARARLMPHEEERLALLGDVSASAMTALFAAGRPGESEAIVAAHLAMLLAGNRVKAPVVLVASDARIARYRHPIPTAKPVEHSLMVVLVAERDGLHVALTRMGWLRGGPDSETRRRFDAVRAVQREFLSATRAGRSLGEVLADGVREYDSHGFADEPLLHHQGGTIGYQARETIATPDETETVEPGMAFAWNPSITGTKAEDTLLLRSQGPPDLVTRDEAWPRDSLGPALWIVDA
jgi:Xaa-Pro aminopeptidase